MTAGPFQLRRRKQHDPAAHSECHQNKSSPLLLNGKLLQCASTFSVNCCARLSWMHAFVSSDQKWECFASKQVDENSLNRGVCCYDSSCRNFHRGGRSTKVKKGLQKEGKKGDKKLFSVKRHLRYSGGRAHMRNHDEHHLASA